MTAASFPQSADQRPVIIAYRLGALGSATTTDGGATTGGRADGETCSPNAGTVSSGCGGGP